MKDELGMGFKTGVNCSSQLVVARSEQLVAVAVHSRIEQTCLQSSCEEKKIT